MPPLVGVAVNVTFVPAQIVLPGLAEMLTAGVAGVLTVTATEDVELPQPFVTVTE